MQKNNNPSSFESLAPGLFLPRSYVCNCGPGKQWNYFPKREIFTQATPSGKCKFSERLSDTQQLHKYLVTQVLRCLRIFWPELFDRLTCSCFHWQSYLISHAWCFLIWINFAWVKQMTYKNKMNDLQKQNEWTTKTKWMTYKNNMTIYSFIIRHSFPNLLYVTYLYDVLYVCATSICFCSPKGTIMKIRSILTCIMLSLPQYLNCKTFRCVYCFL